MKLKTTDSKIFSDIPFKYPLFEGTYVDLSALIGVSTFISKTPDNMYLTQMLAVFVGKLNCIFLLHLFSISAEH